MLFYDLNLTSLKKTTIEIKIDVGNATHHGAIEEIDHRKIANGTKNVSNKRISITTMPKVLFGRVIFIVRFISCWIVRLCFARFFPIWDFFLCLLFSNEFYLRLKEGEQCQYCNRDFSFTIQMLNTSFYFVFRNGQEAMTNSHIPSIPSNSGMEIGSLE